MCSTQNTQTQRSARRQGITRPLGMSHYTPIAAGRLAEKDAGDDESDRVGFLRRRHGVPESEVLEARRSRGALGRLGAVGGGRKLPEDQGLSRPTAIARSSWESQTQTARNYLKHR